jgi:superfamily II DNA/RNA helicase
MRGPYVLIVAPTKELSSQIFNQLQQLIAPFPFIQSLDLVNYLDSTDNQTLNNDLLDILLGTPGRLLAVVEKNPGLLDRIRSVVLDEADLIFSYGYQDEIRFNLFLYL